MISMIKMYIANMKKLLHIQHLIQLKPADKTSIYFLNRIEYLFSITHFKAIFVHSYYVVWIETKQSFITPLLSVVIS